MVTGRLGTCPRVCTTTLPVDSFLSTLSSNDAFDDKTEALKNGLDRFPSNGHWDTV